MYPGDIPRLTEQWQNYEQFRVICEIIGNRYVYLSESNDRPFELIGVY